MSGITTIPAVLPQTGADRAHRHAIRFAQGILTGNYAEQGPIFHDAVAMSIADGYGTAAEVGTFIRAYTSTRRALAIEDRDRSESDTALWRERMWPGDTQHDRARRAGHNEACATAQHMAMVDTCTCKQVTR